jgi:hypothetical protein
MGYDTKTLQAPLRRAARSKQMTKTIPHSATLSNLSASDLANLRTACLTSSMRAGKDWAVELDKLAKLLWDARMELEAAK